MSKNVKGVRPHGNGYLAEPMIAGKRYRHTFDTEAQAIAFVLEAKAAHKLGKPIPVPGEGTKAAGRIGTIDELADHTYKMRWAKRKSADGLLQLAKCFVRHGGPNRTVAEALTYHNVTEYVEARMRLGVGGSSINRHLSTISVMMKMAVSLGSLPKPFELPWQPEGEARLRFFTDNEEKEMLGTLAVWGHTDYIDLFIFLMDTGFRLGEAEAIEWTSIRGRILTVEKSKNGKPRSVPATPRVLEALARRKAENPDAAGPFVWLERHRLRHLWARLRSKLKWMGDDTVIHTFRHTCASRLVQAGMDIYRVKAWMGHKTISTTERYAHLAPDSMDDLAAALAARLAPKAPPPQMLDAAE